MNFQISRFPNCVETNHLTPGLPPSSQDCSPSPVSYRFAYQCPLLLVQMLSMESTGQDSPLLETNPLTF